MIANVIAAVLAFIAASFGGFTFVSTGPDSRSEELVLGFREAGLPVVQIQTYDEENDPNNVLGRPRGYIAKSNFWDARLDRVQLEGEIDLDSGGSVEVFENEDDAKRRFEYLESITDISPMFGEYRWRLGTTVLRVSFGFTPDEAEEYRAALVSADVS